MSHRKKFTIRYLFSYLEDPRYPSVGPHLWLLGLTGLWHWNQKTTLTQFKQYLFYATVIFFCTQYIKCLIKFDADSLMLILQYAPFHLGILKSCYFQKDYKKWENLINFVSSLEREQLSKKDKKYDEIITQYIEQSRRVSYFFWMMAFFSNFSIFSEPYQKNQVNENGTSVYLNIFDGYTPFSQEPPGYYASMAIQTVLGNIVSAYVVAWDTLVVTIMIFFTGQLKVARLNCNRIIVIGNAAKSHENIVRCHRFHIQLIEYQQFLNSLISPAMCVYLFVVSVNLGVCIIQTVQLQNDLGTLLSSCEFVMACLIQLLLFYWHANEVTAESESVGYSTFESDWVDADQTLRKEVALLGLTIKKKFVFKAGPFNVMTLATFIAILRGSYSFYTILNETNH